MVHHLGPNMSTGGFVWNEILYFSQFVLSDSDDESAKSLKNTANKSTTRNKSISTPERPVAERSPHRLSRRGDPSLRPYETPKEEPEISPRKESNKGRSSCNDKSPSTNNNTPMTPHRKNRRGWPKGLKRGPPQKRTPNRRGPGRPPRVSFCVDLNNLMYVCMHTYKLFMPEVSD